MLISDTQPVPEAPPGLHARNRKQPGRVAATSGATPTAAAFGLVMREGNGTPPPAIHGPYAAGRPS
jgi:hypothetical protein